MRFLIDTCVISELAKSESDLMMQRIFAPINSKNLFISSVTIGEIVNGIFLLPHTKKRKTLTDWLGKVEAMFDNQILNFDRDAAVIWGELSAHLKLKGLNISSSDRQIAATALQHGLRVMTRNVKDFEHSGVMVYNPFDNV